MSSAETTRDFAGDVSGQAVGATWRRWAGLVVVCMAVFLEAMNLSSISIQIPALIVDFHLATTTAQLIVSTFLVAYAGFLLLGGRIADWLGRRLVFVSGVTLFGLASLAAGLAANVVLLDVARAVQGLGAAMTAPAAMSIITVTFREGPERNRALAIFGMIGASGFAIGAVVAGVLTSWLNWRWAFFDYVIIAALVLLFTPMLVAKDRRSSSTKQSIDFFGAILSTAGLLILVYTVGEVQALPVVQVIAGLVLAIILLAIFVAIEARVRVPLLPFRVFRLPTLTSANILALAEYAVLICVVFIATLYMQNVLGYTPFQTGLAFLPLGAMAILAANVMPSLLGRLGIKPALLIGLVLMAIGSALASALISVDGNFWIVVLIPTVLVGAGSGMAIPATMVAAVAGAADTDQGLVSGLITTSGQLGGAIGLALVILTATLFTPLVTGAHPQALAIRQALVSGLRPALLVITAFAVLGLLLASASFRSRRAPKEASERET